MFFFARNTQGHKTCERKVTNKKNNVAFFASEVDAAAAVTASPFLVFFRATLSLCGVFKNKRRSYTQELVIGGVSHSETLSVSLFLLPTQELRIPCVFHVVCCCYCFFFWILHSLLAHGNILIFAYNAFTTFVITSALKSIFMVSMISGKSGHAMLKLS